MESTVQHQRIAAVEAIPLRVSSPFAQTLDGSCETVLVRIVDEAGNVGVGETDAPAEIVRDLILMDDFLSISRGLAGMLIGRDPFPIRALYHELYEGTIYHGRRGLGIHALSAVDIALHDLVGKQLGRPAYELLGGARRQALTPYATVWAGPVGDRTLASLMETTLELLAKALALGFRAVKMEVLFEGTASDREIVDCIREGRRALGEEVEMMVDFGYRWRDWRDALWVLNRLDECRLFFVETPLQHDDLAGHAKLARRVETRIGSAEYAATLYECREWLEIGCIDVIQADINRCGGLSEIRQIAELAELHGAIVVPHGWKTGITAAAGRQFQAATVNAPFVELLHPELHPSPLRAELVQPEPVIVAGEIPLPEAPGLGIEVDDDALARFRIE